MKDFQEQDPPPVDNDARSARTADPMRRSILLGAGLMAGAVASAQAAGTAFDSAPRTVNGGEMPAPSPEKTAGPIKAGRGSQLTGKVAVVTGGARGIGRAIALEFAANGADVIILDIAGFVSPASDAAPADRISKAYGHIDIVVADAAIQRWMPLLQMQDSDWNDVIDNNLNGTANTIRAFAPKMVERNKGRIIVLSSMQGKHGTKDASSYSASKWGIIGLMKSAALELGEHNITVNALIPGLVDTPLTRYQKRLHESMAETGHTPPDKPTPQQAWDERKPTVPLKVGWLQPEDIAPAAVFLASDAAAMVTGAEYEVTGGDSAKDI